MRLNEYQEIAALGFVGGYVGGHATMSCVIWRL